MSSWHFIEPMDVLYLRGNKLFGDPGSYGEALVPPWPSTVAGAIRSSILARDKIDLCDFSQGKITHPVLGTPNSPGTFSILSFSLARKTQNGVESLHAIPADLIISTTNTDTLTIKKLRPTQLQARIQTSLPTTQIPVMAEKERSKPARGFWLTQQGYTNYLQGKLPSENDLVASATLWSLDERVGVGLKPTSRRAEDGKLFTAQAVAFQYGIGFLCAVAGISRSEGTLRLGGDGRGARLEPAEYAAPPISLNSLLNAHCCRIVLTAPGIFPEGWRLPGMAEDGNFELNGVRGRVVAAAVSRGETVSGWDLAANNGRGQPKPANRAAPAGSVYWIEKLEATPEALGKLAKFGLWPEDSHDVQRRAEGFNRFQFANY